MTEEDIDARVQADQETIRRIQAMVAEAVEVRFGEWGDGEGVLRPVDPELGPSHVSHELLRVRARSDRMDRILSDLTRVRGVVRRRRESARFDAEQAYNRATTTNASNRTREFVTGRERHAEASLDSFNERRAQFEADKLMDVADEGYGLVKDLSWQLSNIRNDLRATLHSLSFESSLER